MLTSRLVPIALMALFSVAAVAQEAPAPVPAPAQAAPTMPQDCTTQPMRHDHGVEKGTPTPKMAGCAMASSTASSATAKPKAKSGHDHNKFHKQM